METLLGIIVLVVFAIGFFGLLFIKIFIVLAILGAVSEGVSRGKKAISQIRIPVVLYPEDLPPKPQQRLPQIPLEFMEERGLTAGEGKGLDGNRRNRTKSPPQAKAKPKLTLVRLPLEPLFRFTCPKCRLHQSMTVTQQSERAGESLTCPKCGLTKKVPLPKLEYASDDS